ncbi:WD repeat-containing protein 76-like [Aphis gossypii]|uniref:WD repeat-containing protein 76-like n=1 Tax=Aphis gossypii TaxID=80765 RepID=UPI002159AE0F|nr:WD repeat-containing protein 76-like [Aphis gossypii]XP_050054121.1 WD repeat-containing protein 76-like [Aphis gossypii]
MNFDMSFEMDENILSDEDEDLTYEQQRLKRMKKNEEILDTLGINQAAKTLANSLQKKTTRVKKNKLKTTTIEPIKRSLRIAHLSNLGESSYKIVPSRRKREISDFVEKLKDELAITEPVNDFHKLPSQKFVHVLRSLDINIPPMKVIESGIKSLAIHPSETSLIVAAGDKKGNIILYNRNSNIQIFIAHKALVNCISFCSWDLNKLFTTSYDGSFGCSDIAKNTFDIIYRTEQNRINKKSNSTTWHSEYERNFLIGNDSGHVEMIDLRIPNKIINSAWCHERSVRTVQCHPLQKHYFLTSSETGMVSLWDIRSMTDKSINPILQFKHPKVLTSSFFSAHGNKMISTCNDNNIRIFNTEQLNLAATKPIKIIPFMRRFNDNDFQAKWNPGREDAFFMTSMLLPPRAQVFDCDGNVLHDLISENMTMRFSAIEVHPTQAIYVGGNSYGRINIFSTKKQLI